MKHTLEIAPARVEVCPNSIEVTDRSIDEKTRIAIRAKCGISLEKKDLSMGATWRNRKAFPFLLNA